MKIIDTIPQGWRKVCAFARASQSHLNAQICAGEIPVAIDDLGYMWASPDALRNGNNNAKQTVHN